MLRRFLIPGAAFLLLLAALGYGLHDPRPSVRFRAGPVATLDPAVAADHASLRESARAYQTPMRLERPMGEVVARPWVLEAAPNFSAGDSRLELIFKKGIRFQSSRLFADGSREVTPCDWVKSLMRHADPRVASPWMSYLSRRFPSLRDWAARVSKEGDSAYASIPQGLACGGRKAVLEMALPDREFLFFLAHPAASILPVDELLEKKWDPAQRPVGSGPFVLSARGGGELRWKAVERIHPIREIVVETGADGFQDWDRFVRGVLDWMELPRDLVGTLLQSDGKLEPKWQDRGIQLQRIQRADLVFIAFNMKDAVLGPKRGVRQALARAIPAKLIVDKVFGGSAIPAVSALAPGVRGYDPHRSNALRDGDLAHARDQLGFAGHPHGRGLPEFVMGCLSHPVEQELCRAVVAVWEQLGVRVKMETLSNDDRRERIRAGQIQFWPVTWVADFPAPGAFLEAFDPEIGPTEIQGPLPSLVEYRRLLGEVRAGSRGANRALSEALRVLDWEAPGAFLVHRFQNWLIRPGISGLNWQDFAWHDLESLRKPTGPSTLDSGTE